MKFSILVPVYNVEQYFEQCLQSLLNQTYRDFEVILVDDGSTDSSGEICDRYHAEYPDKIRVIHKKNQGQLAARCDAIKAAGGDYCIFADSDDLVDAKLLETINTFLQNNSVDVLVYSYQYIKDNQKSDLYHRIASDGEVWFADKKSFLYERLITTNELIPLWIKAVRTDILKNDPTDYTQYYGKNMAEDLLQSLHILTIAETVGYIYEPLYLYRINENSVSRSFRAETIHTKNTIHVYEKAKEYLEIWGLKDEEHLKKLQARWFNDIMCMFSRYCEEAKNYKEMQLVFSADWNSLFPSDVLNNRNEYENKIYQNLYGWYKEKNFTKIRFHFLKKKVYKRLKNIKSKVKR